MKKLNVICYIDSSGPNVLYNNFEDTVVSISKNINTSFTFVINTDEEHHKDKFLKIFEKNNISNNLTEIIVKRDSWARCFNEFFENFKSKCHYILISHDDLEVRTFDFYNITMKEIEGHENEIAWIGFTSDSYYRLNNNPVCQSAREVFCKDRKSWPLVYEVHKMRDGYNESLLDMPERACKVAGIFPHFNMIRCDNLEKIGLCPEWGNYTLLIDEHWSVQTLTKNLWTVWVPSVYYDHPLRYEKRQVQGLQNVGPTVASFINHWGYNPGQFSNEQIEKLCDKFPNTNLSFFNDKNTFDYQYLK